VLVLEAANRLGGRLHTVELPNSGVQADLGASWIHGIGNVGKGWNPIYTYLQNKSVEMVVSEYTRAFLQDGSTVAYEAEMALYEKLAAFMDEYGDNVNEDVTVEFVLGKYFEARPKLTAPERAAVEFGAWTQIEHEYAGPLSKLSAW
jgi:phytoene dehydrogenase-like protein